MKLAAIYPIIHEEDGLPFILCGVGSQSDQCHMIRKEGFALHQIIFSTQGKGILKTCNQEFEIDEGNFFYLKPHEPHEYYKLTESWSTDWILFRGDMIENTLSKLGFSDFKIGSFYSNNSIKKLFHDILITLNSNDSFKGLTASSQFYRLLIELYRSSYSKTSLHHKQTTAIIEPVIHYIDLHFSEEMTLEELAKPTSVTPEYLCKVFKERLNIRPFEYIAKRRIQEAKKLLISGTMSIKEIGKSVGYNDSSYFCYIFKKYESISPSAFRGAAKIYNNS
jgi:AraC family transcriptional regulator, arabinose operon regulatory protein